MPQLSWGGVHLRDLTRLLRGCRGATVAELAPVCEGVADGRGGLLVADEVLRHVGAELFAFAFGQQELAVSPVFDQEVAGGAVDAAGAVHDGVGEMLAAVNLLFGEFLAAADHGFHQASPVLREVEDAIDVVRVKDALAAAGLDVTDQGVVPAAGGFFGGEAHFGRSAPQFPHEVVLGEVSVGLTFDVSEHFPSLVEKTVKGATE